KGARRQRRQAAPHAAMQLVADLHGEAEIVAEFLEHRAQILIDHGVVVDVLRPARLGGGRDAREGHQQESKKRGSGEQASPTGPSISPRHVVTSLVPPRRAGTCRLRPKGYIPRKPCSQYNLNRYLYG